MKIMNMNDREVLRALVWAHGIVALIAALIFTSPLAAQPKKDKIPNSKPEAEGFVLFKKYCQIRLNDLDGPPLQKYMVDFCVKSTNSQEYKGKITKAQISCGKGSLYHVFKNPITERVTFSPQDTVECKKGSGDEENNCAGKVQITQSECVILQDELCRLNKIDSAEFKLSNPSVQDKQKWFANLFAECNEKSAARAPKKGVTAPAAESGQR